MKIEQIAFGVKYPDEVINEYSKMGIWEWTEDEVEAEGTLFGEKIKNKAQLFFNYQLGYELELLKYVEGPNWHQAKNPSGANIFLSHKGMHVDSEDMIIWKMKMNDIGVKIAQEVFTKSHTNPVIAGKRQYHYVVFDSEKKIGFDLKLIKRINI